MKYQIMGRKTYHLLVNLNWDCPNSCPECWEVLLGRDQENGPFSREVVSWDRWRDALNKLPPSMIDISGGEPTMFEGFDKLIRTLARKHALALSTNLHGNALGSILRSGRRFRGINCSWHKGQGLELERFLNRVLTLKYKGYPVAVNIVDHPLSIDQHAHDRLTEEGVTVHVSPFEDPHEICTSKKWLKCNAGLNTFTITPQGDVFCCLTWFRYFLVKKGFNARAFGWMGNIFCEYELFQKYVQIEKHNLERGYPRKCNLRCDIFYTLDPKHEKKHMFSTYVEEV